MERLERIPVPVIPTFVGALTLSNIYGGMGYTWVRHLSMWAATVFMICYIIKIVKYPSTCKKEYCQVIPGSLYAAFAMVLMILGSYYYDYAPAVGKAIWSIAIVIHATHILIFTYRNVIRKRDMNTFMPSWYVTYNGIMVSCVTGGAMNASGVLRVIVFYGIAVYFVILPFMLRRLLTVEVKDAVYHTMAVLLAPCSLCVVSYLNVIQNPNAVVLYILYACVLASLLFIIVKLPKFFAFSFVPGYAGLTFPMAIGTVATSKMTAFLTAQGKDSLAAMTTQLNGIQLYLTTMIVGYVLVNFVVMLLKIERK
ncbi:MAG: TDT family transporter [Eubacteriales bacterium]|nr:TDT family transporter [Eubacteriales bacterium]